jgi:HK97 gp10 family phage protein
MEGMNSIQQNIRALRDSLLAAAAEAADESAHLLETYAKANAPWTDRTVQLRNSLDGDSEVSSTSARMTISMGKTYGPFVELGTSRSSAYPILWPTVAANVDNVMKIFQKHMRI